MMWNKIETDIDLKAFKLLIEGFHDSCVKEIHYVSGAYVNEDLSMRPINNKRILRLIIQRQYDENSAIELEFKGLKYLKLSPTEEDHTCEILDASLFYENGYFYWCDCDGFSESSIVDYDGTVICASELRWRTLENALGSETIYRENQSAH